MATTATKTRVLLYFGSGNVEERLLLGEFKDRGHSLTSLPDKMQIGDTLWHFLDISDGYEAADEYKKISNVDSVYYYKQCSDLNKESVLLLFVVRTRTGGIINETTQFLV